MTRSDEVIRMANQAAQGEPISGKLCCELIAKAWTPFFERFAAMVAAAERGRCARACASRVMGDNNREDQEAARCAAAIMALGDEANA